MAEKPIRKPVSIRYEADTQKQIDESIAKAEGEFERLVAEGYPSVRIVVSNHWVSGRSWRSSWTY
jgi:hypothetical protein